LGLGAKGRNGIAKAKKNIEREHGITEKVVVEARDAAEQARGA
jgi:hypothetical protein